MKKRIRGPFIWCVLSGHVNGDNVNKQLPDPATSLMLDSLTLFIITNFTGTVGTNKPAQAHEGFRAHL